MVSASVSASMQACKKVGPGSNNLQDYRFTGSAHQLLLFKLFFYFIAAPKACDGVSAPPAPGPAPSPPPGPNPGSCPTDQPGAAGDGYCDDNLNIAACKFDGGDCCPSADKPADWKEYCQVY